MRDTNRIPLTEAIRKMTSLPAKVLGLNDRGVISQGMKADLNVIDMERVAERHPQISDDFPCGASRLLQRAMGYRATVCNGEVILENDEHTGDRGGIIVGGGKRAN